MFQKTCPPFLVLACSLALGACSDWFQMVERREFNVRGIVRGIPADAKAIIIQHEPIPGYMPEATTTFNARKRREVAGLRPGHGISFRLVVTEKEASIDRINLILPEQVWVKAPSPAPIGQAPVAPGLPQP
ncbi:MAG TPA: copper-binding protein [Chthoniobacterales bacterium]|nr:copper-binding protein [Chthoniobacterales bacterium]